MAPLPCLTPSTPTWELTRFRRPSRGILQNTLEKFTYSISDRTGLRLEQKVWPSNLYEFDVSTSFSRLLPRPRWHQLVFRGHDKQNWTGTRLEFPSNIHTKDVAQPFRENRWPNRIDHTAKLLNLGDRGVRPEKKTPNHPVWHGRCGSEVHQGGCHARVRRRGVVTNVPTRIKARSPRGFFAAMRTAIGPEYDSAKMAKFPSLGKTRSMISSRSG